MSQNARRININGYSKQTCKDLLPNLAEIITTGPNVLIKFNLNILKIY